MLKFLYPRLLNSAATCNHQQIFPQLNRQQQANSHTPKEASRTRMTREVRRMKTCLLVFATALSATETFQPSTRFGSRHPGCNSKCFTSFVFEANTDFRGQKEEGDSFAREADRKYDEGGVIMQIESALRNGNLEEARSVYDSNRQSLDSSWLLKILGAHASKKRAHTSAAADAEEWISRTDLTETDVDQGVMFKIILRAWRVSADPSAVERAEDLVERMTQIGLASTVSYNILIDIYSKHGSLKKIELTLAQMAQRSIPPDTETFNTVMKAFVKRGKVMEAEKVLQSMEVSYLKGDASKAPNAVSYGTLMDGWSKINEGSLDRVKEIFKRQNEMYHDHGNLAARPDEISYAILIGMMYHSKRPEEAEACLRQMYEEFIFTGHSETRGSALANRAIHCWSTFGQSDSVERANKLLQWMIKTYQESGCAFLEPNEHSFTPVISAWAKSRMNGGAPRARSLLVQMSDLHKAGVISQPPGAPCYTAVLNACARSNKKDPSECKTALNIAVKTFKELIDSEYCEPNELSFDGMIGTLQHTLPPSEKRATAIINVFNRCAKMGCVDDYILQRIQRCLTKEQLGELFDTGAIQSGGRITANKLPKRWVCNTKKGIATKKGSSFKR